MPPFTSPSLLELVREWPYARDFVLDTMDQDLIQRHGELMLYRALNIGRTVAFIGAGVSMSYGRISWRDLVRGVLRKAETAYQDHVTEDGDFGSKHPRIARVIQTLRELKPDPDTDSAWRDVAPARLLGLFQIADEIGDALNRVNPQRAAEPNPVRREAHQLVYDDAGHARRLLEAAYDSKKRLVWFDNFLERRDLSRRLTTDLPSYQGGFSRATLTKVIEQITVTRSKDYPELLSLLSAFVQHHGTSTPVYLNPTHRFAVAAALLTLDESERDRLLGAKDATAPWPVRPRIRSETVEHARDPLELLVGGLGVRRFITTNYDLDIERLTLDRNYRLRESARRDGTTPGGDFVVESVNAIEARARDFVFRRDRAAHLIDLAIQDSRFALDIVHLHGRATEGDDLVATEADYQRLYLRDEGRRDLLDSAINLAFRGNALLFVGNGMGEDDLLRPLRHFMSEGPSGREAVAVALLPDTKGAKVRVEEKVSLLRRYGVYAVHFGRGKLEGRDQEDFVLSDLIKIVRFLAKRVGDLQKGSLADRNSALDALKREIESNADLKPLVGGLIRINSGTSRIHLAKVELAELQPSNLISCELQTVDYLIDLCLRATCGKLGEREIAAARVLAENIEDAIVAGFLAAALKRIRGGWEQWRSDWFGDIPPRAPAPQPIDVDALTLPGLRTVFGRLVHPTLGLKVARRRAISLRDYDGKAGEDSQGRRFRVEFSQTFAQACAALRKHANGTAIKAEDIGSIKAEDIRVQARRVFVLAGPRGIGKGHFFSALTQFSGILKFLDATWAGDNPTKPYIGAFAFNLSFSVELGSGFDRLTRFLRDRIADAYDPPERTQFLKLCREVAGVGPHRSGNRVGGVELLLRVLCGAVSGLPKPAARFALFFNATNLLFSAKGFSKSADITRIMNVLFDPRFADAPVDIIFVTDERGIPIEFRDRHPTPAPADGGPPLSLETPPHPWAVEVVPSFIEPTRSNTEDEAAVRRLELRRRSHPPQTTREGRGDVALFLRLRPSILGVVAAVAFPKTVAAIVVQTQRANANMRSATPHLRAGAARQIEAAVEAAAADGVHGIIDRDAYVDAIAALRLADGVGPCSGSEIDDVFAQYFKSFGGSRFALTIAFAAADEELVASDDISASVATLDEIREKASPVDDPSRQDAIVRTVLALHRSRGVREACFSDILQNTVWKRLKPNADSRRTLMFRVLSGLCDELLVVLSMIGHPIEADCLAALRFRSPEDWPELFPPGAPIDPSLLTTALDVLVRRCLVFRFAPNVSNGSDRFGVHRHVQRHIFRHLEQPLVEHAEIESYMPTLYASQPNDLPYPNSAAQERIREIVAVLSRYPSRRRLGESDAHRTDDPKLQSRMLRAAYGVIRTVYGIGVVARFHEYGDEGSRPAEGYFEEHRRQVRWLLKRAKDVGAQLTEGKHKEDEYLPFYSGEIAWLYNECGVLCLAQGSLDDASALFAEAVRALNPVERRGTPAALTTAIRLNRALVDMERGNLRKADSSLRDIIAQKDEHRVVRWIAYGYRGLIEHVRGNLDEAGARYANAIKVLTAMKRYRAASIFARHSADLHRCLGEAALVDAGRLADEAVNLAAAGSHSDVLHQARLTRLRIRAVQKGPTSFPELNKEMEGIEAYAKVMGMPRLEVETAYVDASFRRQLGDLGMAMKRVARSLAIANDCDLVLRKISSTVLAAEISRDLGMRDGARTLAETAKAMAIAAEFSGAQDSAQTLLASL
jgi:tetratricopeptide (TPR) repeat protein